MTPQEALAKLSQCGDSSGADYDDGDGGWFGWSVDSESPEAGVLRVTWQDDSEGASGTEQEFVFELRAVEAP